MKKFLLLFCIICLSATYAYAAENTINNSTQYQQVQNRANRGQPFEKRLGLTEEQKIKRNQTYCN